MSPSLSISQFDYPISYFHSVHKTSVNGERKWVVVVDEEWDRVIEEMYLSSSMKMEVENCSPGRGRGGYSEPHVNMQ